MTKVIFCLPHHCFIHPLIKWKRPSYALNYYHLSRTAALSHLFLLLRPWWTDSTYVTLLTEYTNLILHISQNKSYQSKTKGYARYRVQITEKRQR